MQLHTDPAPHNTPTAAAPNVIRRGTLLLLFTLFLPNVKLFVLVGTSSLARSLARSLALRILRRFRLGVPVQEIDLPHAGRGLELKHLVAQLGVDVPAVHEGGVLRLVCLLLERDHEFTRKRLVARVDPDLPVQILLPEREVMALHLAHVMQADIRAALRRFP